MSTMTVPRFLGGGKIEFTEKPIPMPGPGQLLIQVKANALCGSERFQFFGGVPIIPGHEAAGIVAAAGPNTRTKIGTQGVIFLMDFCGQCHNCRRGLTNQCLAKRADMGFSHDGGYAPFELINENIFFPIDPDIPLDDATMLLDIMGTGGHAIARAKLVHDDIRSILIAGAGPIGVGVLAMAKILLPKDVQVFITDAIPWRLNLARELGGIAIDVTKESLSAGLATMDLKSVDVAIDTTGKAAARQASLDALAQAGVLVCVGHGESLTVDVSKQLIAPERAILGSEYFRFDELPANLALLKTHREYLSQIITHRFPLAQIQKAFETFFAGETGKVLIVQ